MSEKCEGRHPRQVGVGGVLALTLSGSAIVVLVGGPLALAFLPGVLLASACLAQALR